MDQPEPPAPLTTPATEPPSAEGGFDHERYKKHMSRVATVSAIVGAGLGVLVVAALLLTGKIDKVIRLLFSPIMFGVGGYMAGVAVVCLFAPREFLTGPVGKPWMKTIGTKSVTVMRIMCVLIGLFALVMVAAAVLLLVMSAFGWM